MTTLSSTFSSARKASHRSAHYIAVTVSLPAYKLMRAALDQELHRIVRRTVTAAHTGSVSRAIITGVPGHRYSNIWTPKASFSCGSISDISARSLRRPYAAPSIARRTMTSTSTSTSASKPWDPAKFKYPEARREEHYDVYKSAKQGRDVKVLDAYRWLEEPPSKSKETEDFIKAQAELTQRYLAQDPNREALKEKLTENWNYARFSAPSLKPDDHFYYSYNSGLQPQSIIYRIHKDKLPAVYDEQTMPEAEELYFDSNRLSDDATAALSATAFSKSGKYWAYGVSNSGSDWFTVYVRKTTSPHEKQAAGSDTKLSDTGRLDDVVRFVKYCGITWLHDDSGFIYQRFPTQELDHNLGTETDTAQNSMLFFHRLGTKQEDDVLIMKDEEHPDWMFGCQVTEDGRYLIMQSSRDTSPKNLTWILDLKGVDFTAKVFDRSKLEWKKVVNDFRASHDYIANDDTKFWFTTNDSAPKSKLVTYDLSKPEEGFQNLIAEDSKAILNSAQVVDKDKLIIIRSRDVKDEMTIHNLYTGEQTGRIAEGMIGTFAETTGKRDHVEFFYKVVGFNNPGLIYRYSFKDTAKQETLFRKTDVKGLRPEEFTTEQVFIDSTDGVKVPMFITTPTGVPKDGTAGALLYAYGGFSIPLDPSFSPAMLTFCKYYGCAFAVVNARGGGEYGEEWHEAGILEHKQNTFSDVQAAAKYLVDRKHAGEKKVIVYGGSNGGVTSLRSAQQKPELFGAVLAAVGVLDLLRYHLFTIGYAWASDYGRSDNPEQFDFVYANSPLHNISKDKGPYPPTLLLTADHDDRVVPLHSFKTIAELQHTLPDNPAPLLMRVDLKAGHGAGKSTQRQIEEALDRFSFVALSLGLEWRGGSKL